MLYQIKLKLTLSQMYKEFKGILRHISSTTSIGIVLDYINWTMLSPSPHPFFPVRNAQVVIKVEEIKLDEFIEKQTASVILAHSIEIIKDEILEDLNQIISICSMNVLYYFLLFSYLCFLVFILSNVSWFFFISHFINIMVWVIIMLSLYSRYCFKITLFISAYDKQPSWWLKNNDLKKQ